MRIVNAKCGYVIPVGRLGENDAVQVIFDVASWKQTYGNGTFNLLNKRNGDANAYPCDIIEDNSKLLWNINSADVANVGYGQCEIVYIVGDTIAKSEIYTTIVGKALTGGGDVPEPWEDWVERVLQAGADAGEAVNLWQNMTAVGVESNEVFADYDNGVLTIGIPASGGGGTSDHSQLSNRDAENQHPISAIMGLQSALDGKQPIGDYAITQTVVNELYPDYSVIGIENRSPHDCTFINNEFVSFNKPEDGGDIVYFNPTTWQRVLFRRHDFIEASGKGLQMKSVDYKYGKLLVGNGRAIADDETSYAEQGAKLYVFHDAENWRNSSGTITFSNCGDYDVIDVSALGYKIYGFWGGADDCVFVSCNLFNDIYLIQLEATNGRYNGNYSVVNHWHQDGYFGDFAAHGGQMYNGSLYLAINDDTKCDVLKCNLCDDGTLKFNVLHFGKKSGNTLNYRDIDGVCIKDGVLYAQPLYPDTYNNLIAAKIDDVGAVYPINGLPGQVLTKTAAGEEWQTPQGGGGGSGVEVIADITLTEEADHIYVTADTSGNPFVLDYAEFDVSIVPTASNTSEAALSMRTNANTNAKGGTFSDFIRMFRPSGAKQFCGGRLYATQCIFGELNTTQGGSVHNYNNIDWNTITAFYFYGGVFGVGSRIVVKGRRV